MRCLLQGSEELRFLRAILDNINEGIIACDNDGNVLFLNSAWRHLQGVSSEAMLSDESNGKLAQLAGGNAFWADGTTPLSKEELLLDRVLRGEHVNDLEILVKPQNAEPRLARINALRR